jgi:hypothetical protein
VNHSNVDERAIEPTSIMEPHASLVERSRGARRAVDGRASNLRMTGTRVRTTEVAAT